MVNQGRWPKCTLKLPCKHYQNDEELKADQIVVLNKRKKTSSLYNRQTDVSQRSALIWSETTKDQSFAHQYLSNIRAKETVSCKREKFKQKINSDDFSYPVYENKSISDNMSIFSQHDKGNPTPIRRNDSSSHPWREAYNKLSHPVLAKDKGGRHYTNLSCNYQSDFVGREHKFTRKKNDSIAMRIRGKSNVIEMKTGSLKHTILEQINSISLKRKKKLVREKRK